MKTEMKTQTININLEQTEELKCKCGNVTFTPVAFLRRVPALLSPSAKEELIPLNGWQCTNCKTLYEFGAQPEQKRPKRGRFLVENLPKIGLFISQIVKIFRK